MQCYRTVKALLPDSIYRFEPGYFEYLKLTSDYAFNQRNEKNHG